MKTKVIYECKSCAYESSKWLGRCPQCNEWNTFDEEGAVVQKKIPTSRTITAHPREPRSMKELLLANDDATERQSLGIDEIDRVFGGGIMRSSLTLITGEPGIGKSTLILQIAEYLSTAGKRVLYVSGEESEKQVALRGKRLGLELQKVDFLCETLIETIIASSQANQSEYLIIDSIQVMYSNDIPSTSGTVTQVRSCTEKLMHFAKLSGVTVFIIGHVTKDGTLAGPRVLEHLVDTVMYVEGSRNYEARILRSVKNRFGSASEVGVFEMTSEGLTAITHPAEFFVEHLKDSPIGTALTIASEGSRPLLLEVQALTNSTVFGYPQRTTQGFDPKRLQLLIAVMQKYLNAPLMNHDVYINIVGGYTIDDPTCDLAICAAILSSLYKKSLAAGTVCIGEVGLTGEIRVPKDLKKIKNEAKKMDLNLFVENNMKLEKRFSAIL